MKTLEKVLELLCVILTIIFFGAVAVMGLGQAACVISLNGAGAVHFSNLIAKPASMVAAVATILAMVLAYIRGQMKS